jgi:ATP-binding cassette subfamily F protein uup
MATVVACQGICKAYGLRELFDDLSIGFEDGEHVGFLGPNGAGKTTFLRIVADVETADRGQVNRRRSARIVYMPQTDEFGDHSTVGDVLEQASIQAHSEDHDHATAVKIIMSKVGLSDDDQRISTLSGGWKKRLALARALIADPDLLLLDEPTNHLDLEGIVWLEQLLQRAPFGFVAVSHDRYFLENVTTRIVELNRAYPEGHFSVAGTYSTFLEQRAALLEAQQAQEAALSNIVRREAEFLKSKAKARRTKSKARIEEAYRLQDELSELRSRNNQQITAGIDFDSTGRKSRKLLEAKGLAKSLGGRALFDDVSMLLSPGSRVGLVGGNGAGKSTLIRVLSGQLEPDSGTIRRAEDLRVVLFDQARETLPQDIPLRTALAADSDAVEFRGRPVHITAWAKRFLFRVDQLDLPVRELSGGEQARILIARLMLTPADVLILDEPTNDLDITSLEVLEDSLGDFPGAIVVVTHDRFMLDRLCNEVWGLDGAGHAGRYASCDQWQAAMARGAAPAQDEPTPKKNSRRATDGLTASERKELQDMERTIQDAEADLTGCRTALDAQENVADADETHRLWLAVEAAQAEVDRLFGRWEELESRVNSNGS